MTKSRIYELECNLDEMKTDLENIGIRIAALKADINGTLDRFIKYEPDIKRLLNTKKEFTIAELDALGN